MPSVTCPGCEKKYNLPATAAGQVASCKCGKKFRVGGAPADAKAKPAAATATAAKPAVKPQPAARAVAPVASVAAAPKPAAPRPAAAATASRLDAPKPKPKRDDGFWDDVDKPTPDLELEPVDVAPRAPSAFRAPTTARARAPQQNILMRMWHSRARKLLVGPPIAVFGVAMLIAAVNKGDRIPRGLFGLIALGVGITWAGLTGESE